MKINITNKEKVQTALDNVQSRCTVRTITADEVTKLCERVEQQLGITKKAMEGIRFWGDYHAQKFPNAYKYTPESTQIKCEYHNGKWYLVEVMRDRTCLPSNALHVALTDDAKAAIVDRCSWFGF